MCPLTEKADRIVLVLLNWAINWHMQLLQNNLFNTGKASETTYDSFGNIMNGSLQNAINIDWI